MASRSFSDLPSEVVIGIFSCLHDHHAIKALDLTSRKFYEIWKLNTATITKAVLPRAIQCFELAQELLAVQSRSPYGGQVETREAVLERSKRLLSNAAVVLKGYSRRISVIDAGTYVAYIASHYHLWIAMELRNDREARNSRLQAATLEELRDMAKMYNHPKFGGFYRGYLDIAASSGYHGSIISETYYAITATLRLKESLSGG